MLEPAFTLRNSTQMILISNQNQICLDLNPTWLACVLKAGGGIFMAKGEISRIRAHEWRKGEVPLVQSIKTNPKN